MNAKVFWNRCFKLLTEITSDGRAQDPDFAKELYLLDDGTDYAHDLQGWLEDYLDELDIRFLLASALESQGKIEKALSLCREWAAQEPDNPFAAAALIYAEISANNLEKKMDHAREEYDKKMNTYLMGMDDEYEFGDDEDFMDEWPCG